MRRLPDRHLGRCLRGGRPDGKANLSMQLLASIVVLSGADAPTPDRRVGLGRADITDIAPWTRDASWKGERLRDRGKALERIWVLVSHERGPIDVSRHGSGQVLHSGSPIGTCEARRYYWDDR